MASVLPVPGCSCGECFLDIMRRVQGRIGNQQFTAVLLFLLLVAQHIQSMRQDLSAS